MTQCAYLGPAGTFTHQAALSLADIKDLFAHVETLFKVPAVAQTIRRDG